MKSETFTLKMLAPCGLTCAACYAHLRKKNPCPGCRSVSLDKPAHCNRCKIKSCADERGILCFECSSFPCSLVKSIDKRYRLRYNISLIENGLRAKTAGIKKHLQEEQVKWTCPHCGGTVSLHSRICSKCERNSL